MRPSNRLQNSKVYCVITDSDRQVKYRQHEKKNYEEQIECFHNECYIFDNKGLKQIFHMCYTDITNMLQLLKRPYY